ncbi:hypothetical protein CJ209_06350 [Fusobacterium nucleatum]|uniref:Uncharacterized protein n=1 Tax=Fusobacterium nucleatum TaxID=851 RepID=A0A2N6TJG2_FUSNU|nr:MULTISPECIES: hypothetical protein [Fusobacterium]EGN64930.1 hypothetical protein HMPREF0404_00978 [Fusobacterium animalis 21_1A]ERT36209.1 hypothetical protein HMPREF1540_01513 [Fusobacterium nucleatum CTI-3]PMC69449.1 hypothetical protein CJ209_06350 [Fusobacterium nucleatum]
MKEILIEFYKIMLKNIVFILSCYLILVIIQIIYLYKSYEKKKLLLFIGNKILLLVSLIIEYYSNKYFGRYGIFVIFYVFGIYILNDNISTTQEQDLLEKEKILIIDFIFFMLIGAILISLSDILKI